MAREQFSDVPEYGPWSRDVLIAQVFVDCSWIDLPSDSGMQKKGFHFRSKNKNLGICIIVKRLFAKAVARQKESFLAPIPDSKCKHASQLLKACFALRFV